MNSYLEQVVAATAFEILARRGRTRSRDGSGFGSSGRRTSGRWGQEALRSLLS
jgi:hypothetical protein